MRARSPERRRGRSRRSAAAAEVGGAQPQVMSLEAAATGEVARALPRPRSLDLGRATEEPLSLRLVLLCIERDREKATGGSGRDGGSETTGDGERECDG